jgi:hypothetical protein
MSGERLVLVPQATQIDDAPYSRIARYIGEILSGFAVFLFELTRRTHGVDEVIRRVYSFHRRR